jgi:hypothetical protein
MSYDQTTSIDSDSALTTVTAEPVTEDNIVLRHAADIKAAWQDAESHWHQSISSIIIECGQRLQNAKDEMKGKAGKGKWLQLFDPAIGNLPFKEDKAERLMAIARNKVLTNSAHARNLPLHWSTLHVLSGAAPKQLEQWIADGTVNPELERSKAVKLVGKKSKRAKAKAKKDDDSNAADIPDTTNEQHFLDYLKGLHRLLVDAAAVDWDKMFKSHEGLIRDVRSELTGKIEAHEEVVEQDKAWEEAQKLN